MEVGNEMKQARIQPLADTPPTRPEPTPRVMGIVNKPGDVIGPSSTPLAIMPKVRTDPRLSRFGSLHARKEDIKEEEEKKKQESAQTVQASHQLQRFGSLYGMRNETQTAPSFQPVQSAYQAQQAKHFSLPNVHRPIRASRLAYHETADEAPTTHQQVTQTPSYTPSVIESPRDEVSTITNGSHIGQNTSANNDEDDFVVDLSSFDGSFVHRSLSRAATRNVSPPSTSYAQNGFHVPHGYKTNESNNQASTTQAMREYQQPVQQPDADIGVAVSDSSQSSEFQDASQGNWPLPSPDKGLSTYDDAEKAVRPSTIVKIVPSAPISSSSSQKSINGQLRLGDWILPESPKSTSAKGFGPTSPVRPVAAA